MVHCNDHDLGDELRVVPPYGLNHARGTSEGNTVLVIDEFAKIVDIFFIVGEISGVPGVEDHGDSATKVHDESAIGKTNSDGETTNRSSRRDLCHDVVYSTSNCIDMGFFWVKDRERSNL